MKVIKSTIFIASLLTISASANFPEKEDYKVHTQCEQDKNDLSRIQVSQSKMKAEDSNETLFDLQKQHDSITADLILVRGLKSLHTDYESFKADIYDPDSEFYSSDFKKMKDSTYKNWRSVHRMASLNYLLDDLIDTDENFKEKVASEDFEGDFFEYLETKCSDNKSDKLNACNIVFNDDALTNSTLRSVGRKTLDISSGLFMSAAREDAKKMVNGFYNAYAISQNGQTPEEKKAAIKSFRTVLLTGSTSSNPGKTLDKTLKAKEKEVIQSLASAHRMGITAGSVKLESTDKSFKETEKGFKIYRDCLVKSMYDSKLSCSPSKNKQTNQLAKEIANTHKFAAESFKVQPEDIQTLEEFDRMSKDAKKKNFDSRKRVANKIGMALKNLTNKNSRLSSLLGKKSDNFNDDIALRSFRAISVLCQSHAKGIFSGSSSNLTINNKKLKGCLDKISEQPERIADRIKQLEDKGNAIFEKMAKIKKQKPYEKLQTIKRYTTISALKSCTGESEKVRVISPSCGNEANSANPLTSQLVDSSNRLISEVDFFIGNKRREFESDLQSVKDACNFSSTPDKLGLNVESGQDPEEHVSNGAQYERSCDKVSEDLHIMKTGTKNQRMKKFLKGNIRRWDGYKWIVKKRKSTSSMLAGSLVTSGIGLVGPWMQYKASATSIEALKNDAMYRKQYMHVQNQWNDWSLENWTNLNNGTYTGWGNSSQYWGSTGTFYGGYPTYYQPWNAASTTATTTSTTSSGFSW